MKDSIILSDKHGLNPSLEICVLCEKEIGIILFGRLKNDEEAPKKVCIGHLCDDCIKKLKDNKERIFFEVLNNKQVFSYIIIKDKDLTPEFLEVLGDEICIYLPEQVFKEKLCLNQ